MPDLDDVRAGLARVPNPIALLESLFAFAPVGLQIYEAAGRCLLVNQAFIELFGSEPPPGYNVLTDEIAAKNGVLGLIHRAFAGETITIPPVWYDPRELRQVQMTEGRRVAMSATFFPLFDTRTGAVTHVGIAYRDQTAELIERAKAEEERDRLRAIVEQSGDGMVVVDEQGMVRIVNRAAQEQGPWAIDVPAERWAEVRALVREDGSPMPFEETPLWRALHGTETRGVVRVCQQDGSVRVLSVTASPLRKAASGLSGAIVITRDETERTQKEAESAQDALFRERFIGILGHDLRSPLTAILASAGLLARQLLPTPARGAAARILSSADRMKRMTSDLLDFTQARLGGGLPLTRRPCEVRALAETVIDEVRAAHPGCNITVTSEGDTAGSFDPDRVTQLLSNLLENALRFSPPDEPVQVSVQGYAAGVEIAVHNVGLAIPADERRAIFDPFRRGSQAGEVRGLGLGLYIVERIAAAHGGRAFVGFSDARGTELRAVLGR
jgi:signal transduction histidine kinase